MSDSFDLKMDATCIHCDNQSCVKLSENPVQVEAYRDQVSLYQRYGAEGSSEALVYCNGRSDS